MSRADQAKRHIERPDGYEPRDANSRLVLYAIVGLIVMTVVFLVAVVGLFKLFSIPSPEQAAAPRAPVETMLPPEPRLERISGDTRRRIREQDRRRLETFGWVDRKSEVVRMPIERAMEIIAARGLPARSEVKKP